MEIHVYLGNSGKKGQIAKGVRYVWGNWFPPWGQTDPDTRYILICLRLGESGGGVWGESGHKTPGVERLQRDE